MNDTGTDPRSDELNLRLTAHRVLLASLFAGMKWNQEEIGMLQEQVVDKRAAARIRAQYPGSAEAYFNELELVLRLATAATR